MRTTDSGSTSVSQKEDSGACSTLTIAARIERRMTYRDDVAAERRLRFHPRGGPCCELPESSRRRGVPTSGSLVQARRFSGSCICRSRNRHAGSTGRNRNRQEGGREGRRARALRRSGVPAAPGWSGRDRRAAAGLPLPASLQWPFLQAVRRGENGHCGWRLSAPWQIQVSRVCIPRSPENAMGRRMKFR